jgi:predicted permease
VRGRLLRADETGPDADPLVAVISERLWLALLGRSEDVAGRVVQVNGQPVTILGVAADGFVGPVRRDPQDMWVPRASLVQLNRVLPERLFRAESLSYFITRVRPDVRVDAAEAQLAGVMDRMAAESPARSDELTFIRPRLFEGLHADPATRDQTYRALGLLTGVVALVLLIACTNVANLHLFRGLSRKADVAMRRTLGATGARVVRQELVESLMLAALGVAFGMGLAWAISFSFRGERLMYWEEEFSGFAFDVRTFAFAAAAVLMTTVLSGLLPALITGRTGRLPEAGPQRSGRMASLSHVLSALQVALCIPLLVGALMLTRTVGNLYKVDLGVSPEGVAVVDLDVGALRLDVGAAHTLHRRLLDTLRALPSVESAGLDVYGPLSGLFLAGVAILPTTPETEIRTALTFVTPGWVEVMRAPVVNGRAFAEDDWEPGTPPQILLTEPLARRIFGRTDVTGRSLNVSSASLGRRLVNAEIIGVVGPLRIEGPIGEVGEEAILMPYRDVRLASIAVLVRAQPLDAEVMQRIQSAVEAAVPGIPVPPVAPLTDRIDRQLTEERLIAQLMRIFAALALLLAAVGLYGVITFAVSARRQEFGIRLALGSTGARIARLVIRQAAAILAAGLAFGLAGAWFVSHLLENRLFGVETTDVGLYVSGTLMLAVVTMAACWPPLRSATRVDPAVTLRGN